MFAGLVERSQNKFLAIQGFTYLKKRGWLRKESLAVRRLVRAPVRQREKWGQKEARGRNLGPLSFIFPREEMRLYFKL